MACTECPYFEKYDLIWRNAAEPGLICVMLWCCAGPELQVRNGSQVVVNEFYATRELVYQRAAQLRQQFQIIGSEQ